MQSKNSYSEGDVLLWCLRLFEPADLGLSSSDSTLSIMLLTKCWVSLSLESLRGSGFPNSSALYGSDGDVDSILILNDF